MSIGIGLNLCNFGGLTYFACAIGIRGENAPPANERLVFAMPPSIVLKKLQLSLLFDCLLDRVDSFGLTLPWYPGDLDAATE